MDFFVTCKELLRNLNIVFLYLPSLNILLMVTFIKKGPKYRLRSSHKLY